jgi:hypothetical protein
MVKKKRKQTFSEKYWAEENQDMALSLFFISWIIIALFIDGVTVLLGYIGVNYNPELVHILIINVPIIYISIDVLVFLVIVFFRAMRCGFK